MVVGRVGEPIRPRLAAGAIADGVDAPVGRAQALVDDDAALVEGDAGRLEAEPVGRRHPPGRDQDVAALDALPLAAVGARQVHGERFALPFDARDRDAGAQPDALLEEGALDHGRHLGVLARQEAAAPR